MDTAPSLTAVCPPFHSLAVWPAPLIIRPIPLPASSFSATFFFCHTHENQPCNSASSMPEPLAQRPQREVTPFTERCHYTWMSVTQKGPSHSPQQPPQAFITILHNTALANALSSSLPRKPIQRARYANTPTSCPCSVPTDISTNASLAFPLHCYSKSTFPSASPTAPSYIPRCCHTYPLCSHTHHAVYLPWLSSVPSPPQPHLT